MTVFDERPSLLEPTDRPPGSRKLWLLGIPILAAVVWICLTLPPRSAHLQQTLREFRSGVPADPGPNRSMESTLKIRSFLLLHRAPKLSASQSAAINTSIITPADDQAQSEALDVMSLAQRANALSQKQAQDAQKAATLVLSRKPGPMVRLEGARLLGHLGDAAGIPSLLVLQNDRDPKIQSAANEALARIRK